MKKVLVAKKKRTKKALLKEAIRNSEGAYTYWLN
jgi:hypothetical protein